MFLVLVGLGYKFEVLTHRHKLPETYWYVFSNHSCPMLQSQSIKNTIFRGANFGAYTDPSFVVGFNHGLPWCVKYMVRETPGTTKPDGEAGGFCGDRRPEGHVFHTSRHAMIKTYYSTSIRIKYGTNGSYFTQKKSTTTAIDDSNRRRNKIGLGCSREATAPLIF